MYQRRADNIFLTVSLPPHTHTHTTTTTRKEERKEKSQKKKTRKYNRLQQKKKKRYPVYSVCYFSLGSNALLPNIRYRSEKWSCLKVRVTVRVRPLFMSPAAYTPMKGRYHFIDHTVNPPPPTTTTREKKKTRKSKMLITTSYQVEIMFSTFIYFSEVMQFCRT